MDFKEYFEYYIEKKFETLGLPATHNFIEEIVRHVDVNYVTPLKSECFTLQQELNKIKKQSKNLQSCK